MLDLTHIARQFPILSNTERGQPLVYLDTAATAQKPLCVLDAMRDFYCHDHANVHRGVYELSERATQRFEAVRDQVKNFLNAKHREEIVFTKGTTEAINLVATSYGQYAISAGDEIIISTMEHHSNIVPWQMLCERTGAVLKIIKLDAQGHLDIAHYQSLFSEKTKLVAIIHLSNVLGMVNPIASLTQYAHDKGVPVLVDGAQAVPRLAVDVQALDCDFYVFSAHKVYGPTGLGVLYAKSDWLNRLPPYQGGGDMIRQVSFEKTEYNVIPYKFEAGTPNIAAVIGLGAALNFINTIGLDLIESHERELTRYALEKLSALDFITIYGDKKTNLGLVSFTMHDAHGNNIHAHDVGSILDFSGVAVRAGHHCAMPLMTHYGVPAMVRASFGVYSTTHDIDVLIDALYRVKSLFSVS